MEEGGEHLWTWEEGQDMVDPAFLAGRDTSNPPGEVMTSQTEEDSASLPIEETSNLTGENTRITEVEDTRTTTGGIALRLPGGGEAMEGWERGSNSGAGGGEVLWQVLGEPLEGGGSMGATDTIPTEVKAGQWVVVCWESWSLFLLNIIFTLHLRVIE